MTIKDKALQYLNKHKRPVNAEFLAARFLCSKEHMRAALGELVKEKSIQRRKVDRVYFYRGN